MTPGLVAAAVVSIAVAAGLLALMIVLYRRWL